MERVIRRSECASAAIFDTPPHPFQKYLWRTIGRKVRVPILPSQQINGVQQPTLFWSALVSYTLYYCTYESYEVKSVFRMSNYEGKLHILIGNSLSILVFLLNIEPFKRSWDLTGVQPNGAITIITTAVLGPLGFHLEIYRLPFRSICYVSLDPLVCRTESINTLYSKDPCVQRFL